MIDIHEAVEPFLKKVNEGLLKTNLYKHASLHVDEPKSPGGWSGEKATFSMGEELDFYTLAAVLQSEQMLNPNENRGFEIRLHYKRRGGHKTINFRATLWGRPTAGLGEIADIGAAKAIIKEFGGRMSKPYEVAENMLKVAEASVMRANEMSTKLLEEKEEVQGRWSEFLRTSAALLSIPATGVMMAITVAALKMAKYDDDVWWDHWDRSLTRLEKLFGTAEGMWDPRGEKDADK